VGKNIVLYGGSDYYGEAIPQLLVFSTGEACIAPVEDIYSMRERYLCPRPSIIWDNLEL
jgi:hypothetical protein